MSNLHEKSNARDRLTGGIADDHRACLLLVSSLKC